jgi:hypothetical protein
MRLNNKWQLNDKFVTYHDSTEIKHKLPVILIPAPKQFANIEELRSMASQYNPFQKR